MGELIWMHPIVFFHEVFIMCGINIKYHNKIGYCYHFYIVSTLVWCDEAYLQEKEVTLCVH
ncbi:MAG: hypothetical protein ACI9D5_002431 [Candidatus Endobugula sp.]|jgi:hypothetical protein